MKPTTAIPRGSVRLSRLATQLQAPNKGLLTIRRVFPAHEAVSPNAVHFRATERKKEVRFVLSLDDKDSTLRVLIGERKSPPVTSTTQVDAFIREFWADTFVPRSPDAIRTELAKLRAAHDNKVHALVEELSVSIKAHRSASINAEKASNKSRRTSNE